MNNNEERLDRAFDILLILIGIISAATFQYVSTKDNIGVTTFALRFLFVPIILLVLIWFLKQLIRNEGAISILRATSWFYGSFTLFFEIAAFFQWAYFDQISQLLPSHHFWLVFFFLTIVAGCVTIYALNMYGYFKKGKLKRCLWVAILLSVLLTLVQSLLAR